MAVPRIELLDLPTPAPEKQYDVRILSSEEIQSLHPIFEKYGADLPDPANSFIVGAVGEDGEIVGFQVTQMRVHVDPLHLKKGVGEHLYSRLIHETERLIEEKAQSPVDVFVFAPEGRISRLAERSGMKPEPWRVLSKRIVPTSLPEPSSDFEPEEEETSTPAEETIQ
jgi:GNAT superfamily N-acetyltransferase